MAFGTHFGEEPDNLAGDTPLDSAIDEEPCPEAAPVAAALQYREWGRCSGVVPWNDHTLLAINPRSETHQLPTRTTDRGLSNFLFGGDEARYYSMRVARYRRPSLAYESIGLAWWRQAGRPSAHPTRCGDN